jgi:leader peptidase (prepilin peptidase)/N-methyltransferase
MALFDPHAFAAMPFHFWSVVFFVFGCITGSFLNVCIYRMPRGQSIVTPPSSCPHCSYRIPFYLNSPLMTWLYLRGKCANCGEPISFRYFCVELLTGLLFLTCWLVFGAQSPWLALVYCVLLSGFVVPRSSILSTSSFDEIPWGNRRWLLVRSRFPFARASSAGKSLRKALGIAVGGA